MADSADEMYCLLVPLADERLLVPRSCVAEVINFQLPTPMEGAPAWYLGTIAWGGRGCRSSLSKQPPDVIRRARADAPGSS